LKPTVKDLVKARWKYAHSDIHAAGFCLDPEFWHLNLNQEVALPASWNNTGHAQSRHVSCQASAYNLANPAAHAQVRNGLFRICKKILGEAGAIEAMLQLEAFRRREGCFGSERALSMFNQMPAYQWWGANVCEEEAGELKSVALKV
jgi:hypothetical protein